MMSIRLVFSLSAILILSNNSFASENPEPTPTPTPTSSENTGECRNYASQHEQKEGKVKRYQKNCEAYQAKVKAAEEVVRDDTKNLENKELSKRQLARLKNRLKSHQRTLTTQKRYAANYCEKVNKFQAILAKFEEKCRPDDAPTNDPTTTVIRETKCEDNGYEKSCFSITLVGDKCYQNFDYTFYNADSFEAAYAHYKQDGYELSFPKPDGSAQVGLNYKIVGRHILDDDVCRKTQS